jgi:hypothetical protein
MGGSTLNQQQIDESARNLRAASDRLSNRDAQLANDQRSQQQAQTDAARKMQQQRSERIQASVKAQQAKNAAEATAIRQGDHVVVDLERISQPEQQTANLRAEYVRLTQSGAHYMAGRVVNVENAPNGIYYQMETENMTLRVPAQAVVRADVFADQNPDFSDET